MLLALPHFPTLCSSLSLDHALINCVVQSLSVVRFTSSLLIIYLIVHSHSFGSFFPVNDLCSSFANFIMLSVVRFIILFRSFQLRSFVLLVHSVQHVPRHLPTPFPSTSQHLACHLHCVPVSPQHAGRCDLARLCALIMLFLSLVDFIANDRWCDLARCCALVTLFFSLVHFIK